MTFLSASGSAAAYPENLDPALFLPPEGEKLGPTQEHQPFNLFDRSPLLVKDLGEISGRQLSVGNRRELDEAIPLKQQQELSVKAFAAYLTANYGQIGARSLEDLYPQQCSSQSESLQATVSQVAKTYMSVQLQSQQQAEEVLRKLQSHLLEVFFTESADGSGKAIKPQAFVDAIRLYDPQVDVPKTINMEPALLALCLSTSELALECHSGHQSFSEDYAKRVVGYHFASALREARQHCLYRVELWNQTSRALAQLTNDLESNTLRVDALLHLATCMVEQEEYESWVGNRKILIGSSLAAQPKDRLAVACAVMQLVDVQVHSSGAILPKLQAAVFTSRHQIWGIEAAVRNLLARQGEDGPLCVEALPLLRSLSSFLAALIEEIWVFAGQPRDAFAEAVKPLREPFQSVGGKKPKRQPEFLECELSKHLPSPEELAKFEATDAAMSGAVHQAFSPDPSAYGGLPQQIAAATREVDRLDRLYPANGPFNYAGLIDCLNLVADALERGKDDRLVVPPAQNFARHLLQLGIEKDLTEIANLALELHSEDLTSWDLRNKASFLLATTGLERIEDGATGFG